MVSAIEVQNNSDQYLQLVPKNIPLKISIALVLSILLLVGSSWATNLGSLPGQTELQSATGNSITKVCAGFESGQNVSNPLQQQLYVTCASMVQNGNQIVGSGPSSLSRNLDTPVLNGAIQNTATEETALPATVTAKTSNSQLIGVMGRISALQSGASGFGMALNDTKQNNQLSSFPGKSASNLNKSGGAASADAVDSTWSKWSGFVNLSGSTGDKDETDREAGFDFNTFGVTGGFDYRITEQFVAGTALGYNRLNSDFNESVNVAGGALMAMHIRFLFMVCILGTLYTLTA